MTHEIGHTMGFGHYWHAGSWNMMGARAGVGIMNTWERYDFCSWLPSNYIQTINTPGTYNINLTDFVTTGKSVILSATNGGRYVIENRSGVNFYSRLGSWVMPDNGIAITYYPYASASPLTLMGADHKWNWVSSSGTNCSYCENNFQVTFNYPFTQIMPSITGISDLDLISVCTNNGCKNSNGAGGNYGDAYKIGYNQIFSSWSNPQAVKGPSNNDICVDILNHNADSSYDILIKYDINNAFNETHPSKPLWLRSSKDFFHPYNPKIFHPKLEWLPNTEPDINGYKILRGQLTNPNIDPQYYYIATVYNGATTTWIDNDITLYESGGGHGVCTLVERTYAYKIIAFDTETPLKESVRSDRSLITGYLDPCAPQMRRSTDEGKEIPHEFSLFQNYPNPFNPSTEIKFDLPQNTFVTLRVYNAVGQVVAELINNEYKSVGSYSVSFDGSKLASGIYFYSIDAGAFKDVKKMVLIK